MTSRKRPFGLAALAAAAGLAALGLWSERARADINTVIVMDDTPYPCKVIKHDEDTITIYLIETKTAVEIRWDKLSPSERRRLKNLVTVEDPLAGGKPMGK